MSITPAELANLVLNSTIFITSDGDFDCPETLKCSSCPLNDPDSNSCRFWSHTPDFINLTARRKAIAYLHTNHPEFFL